MAETSSRTHLSARFSGAGPKRILSLDGGGVRGLLSCGVLSELERRLARRSGKGAAFRLCDYFDLIGGTSTGSIIAAGLAMGRTVEEIANLYRELALRVFSADGENAGIRKPRFDSHKLEEALAREFGDHELGSPALKTGFAIFAKRIDTGSAWTLTNNPRSKYWNGPDGGFPNRRFQIRKLVLASAAAPTFFEERRIQLVPDSEPTKPGVDREGEFVDGGVAALNDPSLQLLKIATLAPYGFSWGASADQLMMLSIGTGYWRPALTDKSRSEGLLNVVAPVAASAVFALQSMIHDASLATLTTMQGLSASPKPWRINSEIEDMTGARMTPAPLLHFQRFDARLDDEAEMRRIGVSYPEAEIEALKNMAAADDISLAHLYEIGRVAGEDYFRRRESEPDWEAAILPARFDPAWFTCPPQAAKSRLGAMSQLWGGSKKSNR